MGITTVSLAFFVGKYALDTQIAHPDRYRSTTACERWLCDVHCTLHHPAACVGIHLTGKNQGCVL